MVSAKLLLAFQMVAAHQPTPPPKLTAKDLARGEKLFQAQCAYCHGARGDGGRGANLARPKLRHAPGEQALFRLISGGIPGTGMPGNVMSVQEVWQVAGYVRSLGRVKREPLPGDPKRGQQIYASQGCANCHTINGSGGPIGPDLTDIGARSSALYLRRALVEPEADTPSGFLEVRAVTRDGGVVSGVRLNEDAFSIQMFDLNGRLHSFWKHELKELHKDWGKSPMPSYRDSLTPVELDDLVAYLVSREGAP